MAQIEPVDGTVLDVGCNDGTFSKIIYSKTGAKKLVGIDVVKPAIAWAAKHWQYPGMKFLVGDAHHLKFKNGSFSPDLVFLAPFLPPGLGLARNPYPDFSERFST